MVGCIIANLLLMCRASADHLPRQVEGYLIFRIKTAGLLTIRMHDRCMLNGDA